MFDTSRRAAVAALVIAGLAACGCSGASPAASSGLTTTEPSTVVVLDQSLEALQPGDQRTVDFTLPHPGALVLTVRWNDPNNSVVAVLTGTGCRSLRNQDGDCRVRRSIERQGKEGREQFIDSPDAAGAYQLLVENEGPGVESIRVNAELTFEVAAPPPLPSPAPTQPPAHPPVPRQSGEPR